MTHEEAAAIADDINRFAGFYAEVSLSANYEHFVIYRQRSRWSGKCYVLNASDRSYRQIIALETIEVMK